MRAVVRDAVCDDASEGFAQAIVIEAAGRDEVIVPIQAPFQLTLVCDADPVAVHAELCVVHRVHDFDLRAVEDVDPAVVHLTHEDLVGATLEPLLERVDVDHPIFLADKLGHELNQLQLQSVAVGNVLDHPGDVRERLFEHDHVQLDGLQADPQRLPDSSKDRRQLALPDVPERGGIEGVDRDVHAFQPGGTQPLRALRKHRSVRRHRHVGNLADGTIDDLLHVQPNKRLPAREFHGPNTEFARDPEEPFDLLHGHLVLMRHSRLQDRAEAFIVAVNAAEIASLRDAHADVCDLTSERVDKHERAENPRKR